MSKIINFFGGPGIGKSTQSADLFSVMKKNNLNVELTFEYPKLVAWEENYSSIKDQFFITANQHRNISRLHGKVDYIIVDSPIIFGLIYKDKYSDKTEYPTSLYGDSFDVFIVDLFKKYDNINILLKRDDSMYNNNGRFQDLESAKEIDELIKEKLNFYNIPYFEYEIIENLGEKIFKDLKNGIL